MSVTVTDKISLMQCCAGHVLFRKWDAVHRKRLGDGRGEPDGGGGGRGGVPQDWRHRAASQPQLHQVLSHLLQLLRQQPHPLRPAHHPQLLHVQDGELAGDKADCKNFARSQHGDPGLVWNEPIRLAWQLSWLNVLYIGHINGIIAAVPL